MDGLLAAIDALCHFTTHTPDIAVMVVIDHPEHGRGGFVHVPTGSTDSMTVLGSLGVVALQGNEDQQQELFDAIGMFLMAPEAAEA